MEGGSGGELNGSAGHSQLQDTARAAADRERGGTTESTHCFFAAENMGIERVHCKPKRSGCRAEL